MTAMRALLLTAAVAGLSSTAIPAAAQPEQDAAQLFESALEAMKRGEYDVACPALAESYRLEPLSGALFTLAECEARAGKLASAWRHFSEFIAVVEGQPASEAGRQARRRTEAKRRRDELGPKVPRLTVEVRGNLPPGAVIERDGQPLVSAQLDRALMVDPGSHVVVLRLPDGRTSESRVELQIGESKQADLVVPAALPAPPSSPHGSAPETKPPQPDATDADRDSNAHTIGGWVAIGIGVVGLGVAGVSGAMILGKKDTLDDNCNGSVCNEEGFAEADDIPTLNVVGTVGFGVGVAALATGVILLLVAPDPDERATSQVSLVADPNALGVSLQHDW